MDKKYIGQSALTYLWGKIKLSIAGKAEIEHSHMASNIADFDGAVRQVTDVQIGDINAILDNINGEVI